MSLSFIFFNRVDKTMGPTGLRHVSEIAVLNANYLMNKLRKDYELPYDRICMHEFDKRK